MWLIQTLCREEHMAAVIDLQHPHMTEYPQFVFKAKAGDEMWPDRYELGKVQWKLAKEEAKLRRKQKRAAMLTQHSQLLVMPITKYTPMYKYETLGQAVPAQAQGFKGVRLHDALASRGFI